MKQSVNSTRAFTLVELLCVSGVICVLSGLAYGAVLSALGKIRLAEDLSTARSLTQAYLAAAADQDGRLLPGRYAEGKAPDVTLADGSMLSQKNPMGVVRQRYIWHLEPYFNGQVERAALTWVNRQEFRKSMKGMSDSQYYYNLSVNTAFGQNACGVGGYEASPNSEAATRLGAVPKPGSLIVFLTANDANLNGYPHVLPPALGIPTTGFDGMTSIKKTAWSNGDYSRSRAANFGYIAFNHGGRAVAGFLDGHSALVSLDELRDSRRWSAVAQQNDDPRHVIVR